MKCIGPESWCVFIEERTQGKVGQDLVVVCLNPSRHLRQYVNDLAVAVTGGKEVICYSLTSREDLDRDPLLAELLPRTQFIQGPQGSVVDFLLHSLPRV